MGIAMCIEKFCFPRPVEVTYDMMIAQIIVATSVILYALDMKGDHINFMKWGYAWLNSFLSFGTAIFTRLFVAKTQAPLDMSISGCVLLQHAITLMLAAIGVFLSGEFRLINNALHNLTSDGVFWISIVGLSSVGMSFTTIWGQSCITAGSFLLAGTMAKIVIILLETGSNNSDAVSTRQTIFGGVSVIASLWYCLIKPSTNEDDEDIHEAKNVQINRDMSTTESYK